MDAELERLAKYYDISEEGINRPSTSYEWVKHPRIKWTIEIFPILYTKVNHKSGRGERSSYGLKHEIEDLFTRFIPELSSIHYNYISNGELILALAYLRYHPKVIHSPNAFYFFRDNLRGLRNKGGKQREEALATLERVRVVLQSKLSTLENKDGVTSSRPQQQD